MQVQGSRSVNTKQAFMWAKEGKQKGLQCRKNLDHKKSKFLKVSFHCRVSENQNLETPYWGENVATMETGKHTHEKQFKNTQKHVLSVVVPLCR